MTAFLPIRERARGRLLAGFATACTLEVVVITTQAWRGVPSHFNVSTAFNATMAYSAAAGGAAIIAITIAFVAAAMRRDPEMPPSLRLAVRVGLASFVVALLVGAAMIGLGVRTTRIISQEAAYSVATYLKPAHAATMHGVLVLPALAWLASFTDWTEGRRVRVVAVACAGYLLGAGVVVVESVEHLDPARTFSSAVPAIVAAAAVICLVTAVTVTMTAAIRSPDPAG